jgi:hypothetical protein
MNLSPSGMILTRRKSLIAFVSLTLLLLSLEAWVATRVEASHRPDILAIAITIDLVVGVPLLYYLLLVRKNILPLYGVVPLGVLTLVAIRFILPASEQSFLRLSEFLIPAIELVVAVFLLIKIRRIIRDVRSARSECLYFIDSLRTGIRKSVKSDFVTSIMASEMSMLYLVFVGWFARFGTSRQDVSVYSYHRKSSYLLWALVALVVVETGGVHLVITIWTQTGAWIFTAISAYTILWLVGHFHAARLQPVVVDDMFINVRTGLIWRVQIPLSDIGRIRKRIGSDSEADGYVNVAMMGAPDIVVALSKACTVEGFFGRKREATLIGIGLDDPEALLADVRRRLSAESEVIR